MNQQDLIAAAQKRLPDRPYPTEIRAHKRESWWRDAYAASEADNADLRKRLTVAEAQIEQSVKDGIVAANVIEENADLRKRLEESEAAAAVKHAALERARRFVDRWPLSEVCDAALASDAGRAMLAKLDAAKKLRSWCKFISDMPDDPWLGNAGQWEIKKACAAYDAAAAKGT